jgi:flagellar hook-basal body complex protein FliE
MAPIEPIVSGVINAPDTSAAREAGKPGSSGFADALAALVDGAEKDAATANEAVAGMLNQNTDVHDAMIALQRAELSLQLAVQIRNKLVQAYNDIMRMPV